MKEFGDHKVHQPRWSNHVQVSCLVAPHPPDERKNDQAAERVNVYLARFSKDFRRIEVTVPFPPGASAGLPHPASAIRPSRAGG